MSLDFLKELKSEGILADGAIGTEIYARGIFLNKCYDELNLSNPKIIREIHESYIKAGARLLETNTFTANRLALAAHGLESQLEEINIAGVKLAREAAGNDAYVAGSMGPVSWAKKECNDLDLPDFLWPCDCDSGRDDHFWSRGYSEWRIGIL